MWRHKLVEGVFFIWELRKGEDSTVITNIHPHPINKMREGPHKLTQRVREDPHIAREEIN